MMAKFVVLPPLQHQEKKLEILVETSMLPFYFLVEGQQMMIKCAFDYFLWIEKLMIGKIVEVE